MKTRRLIRFAPLVWWIAIAALLGVVVMLLWNWLIPPIFGLAAIGYWQALGLFLLARILFGGFHGGRKMMHNRMMHEMHNDNPIREKWMNMTAEERKEFINKRRAHMQCGPFGRPGFFNDHNFNFDDNDNHTKDND